MMTHPPQTTASYLRREAEYEQLVRELIDRTAFGPVAITTGLGAGVLGFGKTTLARAVAADPRVRAAFPDGIFWASLHVSGVWQRRVLEPLSVLRALDSLITQITGVPTGITDLAVMENSLHAALHPLRALLVLDDVNAYDTIRPFLHSGPGGATLIVAYDDSALPYEARRVVVDAFAEDEGMDVLLAGIAEADALFATGTPGESLLQEVQPGSPLTGDAPVDAVMAGRALMAQVEQMEHHKRLVEKGAAPEIAAALQRVCGRLNGWPLLVTLANGLLRSFATGQPGQALFELLQTTDARLERRGLPQTWPLADSGARMLAARALVDALIDTLPSEDRERCAVLAVFPTAQWIPLAAASRLWGIDWAEEVQERLADLRLLDWNASRGCFRIHPVLHGCFEQLLGEGELVDLHRRLVDAYAADAPQGWASLPDDGYIYRHLPEHLLATQAAASAASAATSGRSAELTPLLFDFNWLAAYLDPGPDGKNRPDLYTLVQAYDLALAHGALDSRLAGLRLVREAIRLSIPSLAQDPGQFAAQMLGRLLTFDDPQIQGMLRQAAAWEKRAWLRPMTVCFTMPGGDELRVMKGHGNWVTGVALLPDALFAVSVSLDGTMRLWNLSIGQQVYAVEAHPGGVVSVAVSPDGKKAVTGGTDGKVRVWTVETGQPLMTLDAHSDAVGALAITPDGSMLITAGDDKIVSLWEFDSGQRLIDLSGHTEPVRSLALTPDGRTLISGGMDDTLRIWDLDNGHLLHQLSGHTSWVRAITTTPDGYYAVSAGWDRTLRVWDLFTGEEILNIDVFATPIYSIAVTGDGQPDGKNLLVLCGAGDGTLRMLDFYSGEELLRLEGHSGGINALAVAKGGQYAITGADDRTLRVWDLKAALRTKPDLTGSQSAVLDDALVPLLVRLPGGAQALTGSADGTLKLWDMATGQPVRVLAGHYGGVPVVAVDGGGRRAVSGAPDQMVRVWNLETGQTERVLEGHRAAVSAVSITPGGQVAISGDITGALFVWDLTGAESPVAVFQGEGAIMGCEIDAQGHTVAVSEAGGKMYFLEIKR